MEDEEGKSGWIIAGVGRLPSPLEKKGGRRRRRRSLLGIDGGRPKKICNSSPSSLLLYEKELLVLFPGSLESVVRPKRTRVSSSSSCEAHWRTQKGGEK